MNCLSSSGLMQSDPWLSIANAMLARTKELRKLQESLHKANRERSDILLQYSSACGRGTCMECGEGEEFCECSDSEFDYDSYGSYDRYGYPFSQRRKLDASQEKKLDYGQQLEDQELLF